METWLHCKISEGQFGDEYAVRGELFDGSEFSLFLPNEFVDPERPLNGHDSVPAWVKAEVLDARSDLLLVRLPRETLESGRWITVRRDQLQTRPTP